MFLVNSEYSLIILNILHYVNMILIVISLFLQEYIPETFLLNEATKSNLAQHLYCWDFISGLLQIQQIWEAIHLVCQVRQSH